LVDRRYRDVIPFLNRLGIHYKIASIAGAGAQQNKQIKLV